MEQDAVVVSSQLPEAACVEQALANFLKNIVCPKLYIIPLKKFYTTQNSRRLSGFFVTLWESVSLLSGALWLAQISEEDETTGIHIGD